MWYECVVGTINRSYILQVHIEIKKMSPKYFLAWRTLVSSKSPLIILTKWPLTCAITRANQLYQTYSPNQYWQYILYPLLVTKNYIHYMINFWFFFLIFISHRIYGFTKISSPGWVYIIHVLLPCYIFHISHDLWILWMSSSARKLPAAKHQNPKKMRTKLCNVISFFS